ncbi:MAG TPA: hypothetical protein VLJ59_01705 [Mycobacteriales bacterium]|nr:hypothetical protein [Mycobacteriales bacterium]
MTSALSRHEAEIPFDQVPGRWAEVAERVDQHERLRLVRGGSAPALVVMTADDFDQAVEDAADLALCREALARIDADPRPPLVSGTAEFEAFLQRFAHRA